MRILEIMLLSLLLATTLGFLWPKHKRHAIILGLIGLAVLVLLAHLVWEGYRWQMLLGYGLTAVMFGLGFLELQRQPQQNASGFKKIVKVLSMLISIACIAATSLLCLIFPVPILPNPTGTYLVGCTTLHLTDATRPETLAEDSSHQRELLVKIWYPASPNAQAKAGVYREHAEMIDPYTAESLGLPRFFFDHLALVQSHSYPGASVSEKEAAYPVLIFSCGYGSLVDEQTLYMEELASHGYIVASLGHSYECVAVVYPNGKVILQSKSLEKEFQTAAQKSTPLWEKYFQSTDPVFKEGIARQMLQQEVLLDRLLRIRVADVKFVVDELDKINKGSPHHLLTGKLDLTRLGIFGHSLGGAVAGQISLADQRFRAAANLDGFQFGDMIHEQLRQPFMMMYSELFRNANDFVLQRMNNPRYVITIHGSMHINYSDNPCILPIIRRLGIAGSIDPYRMNRITTHYLLAFFDQYLKGIQQPLLAGESPYPEVTITYQQ